MTSSRKNDSESRPINLVLMAISFIIFGVLGIVFMTQMDLQPGWAWEDIRDVGPVRLYALETEDINGNGVNDIIGYADIQGTNDLEEDQTLQFGGIYSIEGSSGKLLWSRTFTDPVRRVFPIMDVNDDGIKDYFYSQASITSNVTERFGYIEAEVLPNMYINKIINGKNGLDISTSFTNNYVHKLVLNPDSQNEFIVLEIESEDFTLANITWNEAATNCSIISYYINGTIKNSINDISQGTLRPEQNLPAIELFQFTDQSHLLFVSDRDIFLYNLSSTNFLEQIYNATFPFWFDEYAIIEDLNSDSISELLLSTWDGNVTLVDGSSGGIIRQFAISQSYGGPVIHSEIRIEEIYNPPDDGEAYLLFKAYYKLQGSDLENKLVLIYSLDLSSQENLWQHSEQDQQIEGDYFPINEDLNGDSIGELVFYEKHDPLVGFGEIIRYTIFDFITGDQFAVMNTQYYTSSIKTVSDFDGDGRNDILLSEGESIILLSSRKPVGL